MRQGSFFVAYTLRAFSTNNLHYNTLMVRKTHCMYYKTKGKQDMEMQIIRKIDKLGRVVIPKDVRTSLGLDSNDDLEIRVENGCIVIKKKNAENH